MSLFTLMVPSNFEDEDPGDVVNVALTREQAQQAIYALDKRITFILEVLASSHTSGDMPSIKAEYDATYAAHAVLQSALDQLP